MVLDRTGCRMIKMTINQYRKGLHCIRMAESLEQSANDNLSAWVMLGQTEKYTELMRQARVLRQAENLRTITDRREYLNSHGIYL